MDKIKVEYITDNGYVEEELVFEDGNLEESVEELIWDEPDLYFKATKSNITIESAMAVLGSECKRFKIASTSNWPETKTEWKNSCTKIPLNGKVCTKLPRLYRRTCSKTVFAEVCYPSNFENSIKRDIEDCAKGAAVAAVAAAIATGASGALPVFELAFKGCLAAKIGDKINQVKFGIKS